MSNEYTSSLSNPLPQSRRPPRGHRQVPRSRLPHGRHLHLQPRPDRPRRRHLLRHPQGLQRRHLRHPEAHRHPGRPRGRGGRGQHGGEQEPRPHDLLCEEDPAHGQEDGRAHLQRGHQARVGQVGGVHPGE